MGTSEDFHSLDPDPEEFRDLGYSMDSYDNRAIDDDYGHPHTWTRRG